jgi:Zn-dependent protease
MDLLYFFLTRADVTVPILFTFVWFFGVAWFTYSVRKERREGSLGDVGARSLAAIIVGILSAIIFAVMGFIVSGLVPYDNSGFLRTLDIPCTLVPSFLLIGGLVGTIVGFHTSRVRRK